MGHQHDVGVLHDETTGVCPSALSNYANDSDSEEMAPMKKVKADGVNAEKGKVPTAKAEAISDAEAEDETEADIEPRKRLKRTWRPKSRHQISPCQLWTCRLDL